MESNDDDDEEEEDNDDDDGNDDDDDAQWKGHWPGRRVLGPAPPRCDLGQVSHALAELQAYLWNMGLNSDFPTHSQL